MKYLYCLFFLWTNVLFCQNILFNKSIELNPDVQGDSFSTTLVDEIGNIYGIGKTTNRYIAYRDSLIVSKMNIYGDLEWIKRYDIHAESTEVPNESLLLLDGSLVIGGRLQYYDNLNINAFLLKLDSLGNMVWYQEYGNEYYQGIFDLKPTLDGGFIFGQRTNDPELVVDDYDGWVVKTDSLGNVEWEQTFGDELWYSVRSIEVSDTGYSVLVGGSDGDFGVGFSDVYHLDFEGNITSQYTLEEEEWYTLYSWVPTRDNGFFVIAGNVESVQYTANAYLFKLDSLGNTIWDLEISNGVDQQEWLSKGIQLSDGSFMICGSSFNTAEEDNNWRGWLVKVSEEGELLWSKVFQHDEDNYWEYFQDIALHPDGSIVIVGWTGQDPEPEHLNITRNNMWVLKVDEEGNDWLPIELEVEASDTFVCVGDSIHFSTFAYNGRVCAYSNGEECVYDGWWSGTGSIYLDDSLSQSPVFVASETGVYSLTYTLVDQAGDTASVSLPSIAVFAHTAISGLDNDTLYVGDSLDIQPILEDINAPYTSYEWSGSGTDYLIDLTDNTTFIAQDSGVYELSFYYEFGSDCWEEETFYLTVLDTMTITSISPLVPISKVTLYPNPAQDFITINNHLKSSATLIIYDVQGRPYQTLYLQAQEIQELEVVDWENGSYYYTILSESGESRTGKLLILR